MTDSCDIIERFWEELDKSPFLMLGIPEQKAHSLPMTAQFDKDYPNSIFFYTRKDNRLVENLVPGANKAMAQFSAKGHDFFACVEGNLSAINDPALRDKFWSNAVSAWFEGGKDDPNLAMLRLDLQNGEFWEADFDLEGAVKMIFGGKIDQDKAEDKHLETAM